jgi:hypothetical protein
MTGVRSHVFDAACNENAESDGTLHDPGSTTERHRGRRIMDDHSDAMLFPLDARKIGPFQGFHPTQGGPIIAPDGVGTRNSTLTALSLPPVIQP